MHRTLHPHALWLHTGTQDKKDIILLPLSDEDAEFYQGVDQQQLFKCIK